MQSQEQRTITTDLKKELNQALTGEKIELLGSILPETQSVLTPEAVRFVAKLVRLFSAKREALLLQRNEVQERINHGILPNFLPESKEIRESSWSIASVPSDLLDRRVEITGPMDRKMVVNALNSGAKVYMTDSEDSHSPTWLATIQGQANVMAAVSRTIDFTSDEGKAYKLNAQVATLFFRPRGWHLLEKHLLVDGKPVSASLFDFGLYFYHNAKPLLKKGSGPYFYLPKMEHYLEARLWNDVFVYAQKELGVPLGTIKATVLIETILAAFQMHEILFELKQHSAGLNCGRWDYIFSFIKKFRNKPDFVLPDRALVTMNTHFLKSYVDLLVQTCHRRGAHAMGGMAAQIPIKNNPEANAKAMEKVIADKKREVQAGHDGTWIAHPGLVPVVMPIFQEAMPGLNQIHLLREDVDVSAHDLLAVPQGEITEQGLRTNINVGIQYLAAWLKGNGCVPLYHLMEDAATAEISRAQVWQWIYHKANLSDGRQITETLVQELTQEAMTKIKADIGQKEFEIRGLSMACELFKEMMFSKEFAEFLTIPAYQYLD